MATNKLSIIATANPPITVQLFPVDSDEGENGINLTGATAFSAKAKLAAGSGSAITFASVSVISAALGKVELSYLTSDFTTANTYNIQIQYQDSGGNTHIYPSDGNTLVLLVKEKIT